MAKSKVLRDFFRLRKTTLYEAVSVTALIALIWIVRWPTLSQPLLENHSFRQTQTAYQSLTLSQNWGSLLHPKLPILGSPWEVPFEFPLFQYSAAILIKIFSFETDFANRLASLIWFSLCVLALWKFVRRFLYSWATFATLVVFSFSAFSLQWSRAALIEYCALFFAIIFVDAIHRLWTRPSVVTFLVASGAATISGLVKSTTFYGFLILAVLLLPNILGVLRNYRKESKRLLLTISSALIGVFAVFLWTRHADAIKNKNPATRWLQSEELNEWNFGTIAQRRIFANWDVIFSRMDSLVIPKYSLLGLLVLPFIVSRVRRLEIACLVSIFITIVTFFNLYVVHDYYLVGVSVQMAILVGCAFQVVVHTVKRNTFESVLKHGLAIVAIVLWLLIPTKWYWMMSRSDIAPLTTELTSLTEKDQYVFVGGRGWDPTLLYYAKRQGLMLEPRGASISEIGAMPDLDQYDFYHGPIDAREVITLRGLYAPVGQETFRIDDSITAFTEDLVFSALDTSQYQTKELTTLSCIDNQTLDVSMIGNSYILLTESIGNNYFVVNEELAKTPVGKSIFVNTNADKSMIPLRCEGDGTVVVYEVVPDP